MRHWPLLVRGHDRASISMGAPSRVPEDLLCEPHSCNNSNVLQSPALPPHLIGLAASAGPTNCSCQNNVPSLSPLLYSKPWEQLWGLSRGQGPLRVTRTPWPTPSHRYALQGFTEPKCASRAPVGKHLLGFAQLFPPPRTPPLGSASSSGFEVWELRRGGPQHPGHRKCSEKLIKGINA